MGISTDKDLNDNVTIQDGAGSGDKAKVGTDKRLWVDAQLSVAPTSNWFLEAARGNLTGISLVRKFGANFDIDTATEDIWDGGGLYTYPTSALTTTVVSDDANDTSAGTGAQSVHIYGLDSNWDQVTQTVTLNGLTPVTLGTALIRVWRVASHDVGSGGKNAGMIAVKHSSTNIGCIPAGRNQSLMTMYTVPANKTAYLYHWHAEVMRSQGSTGSKQAEVRLMIREPSHGFAQKDVRILSEGFPLNAKHDVPHIIPEKSDVKVQAESTSNNTSVTAGYDLILVDN